MESGISPIQRPWQGRAVRASTRFGTFVSDEVPALERQRVFRKGWLCLGRTSDLNKPGDFVSRRVGGRPLIFTRDRKNKVHALQAAV